MPEALLAGLSPKWLSTAADKGYDLGRNQAGDIGAEVKQAMADLGAMQGLNFQVYQFNGVDEVAVNDFAAVLRSKTWDVVSLGGGVRTIPQLGEVFTDLVNLVITEQPKAKLMFPLTPKESPLLIKKFL